MGVSRLDSFNLATAKTTTGVGTAPTATPFVGPVNGLVTFITSGTFTGLACAIEAFDGTNWVPITGISITAVGTTVWQGTALGLRVNNSAITTGSFSVVVVLVDY